MDVKPPSATNGLSREQVLDTARVLFQHYGWNNANDIAMRERIEKMRDMALSALSETRCIYCDNCQTIRPLVVAPMDGMDVTGRFGDPADLLCGDCHFVIATTYAAPQEEHTQRTATADAGGHHPAGAAPASVPSASRRSILQEVAINYVAADKPVFQAWLDREIRGE